MGPLLLIKMGVIELKLEGAQYKYLRGGDDAPRSNGERTLIKDIDEFMEEPNVANGESDVEYSKVNPEAVAARDGEDAGSDEAEEESTSQIISSDALLAEEIEEEIVFEFDAANPPSDVYFREALDQLLLKQMEAVQGSMMGDDEDDEFESEPQLPQQLGDPRQIVVGGGDDMQQQQQQLQQLGINDSQLQQQLGDIQQQQQQIGDMQQQQQQIGVGVGMEAQMPEDDNQQQQQTPNLNFDAQTPEVIQNQIREQLEQLQQRQEEQQGQDHHLFSHGVKDSPNLAIDELLGSVGQPAEHPYTNYADMTSVEKLQLPQQQPPQPPADGLNGQSQGEQVVGSQPVDDILKLQMAQLQQQQPQQPLEQQQQDSSSQLLTPEQMMQMQQLPGNQAPDNNGGQQQDTAFQQLTPEQMMQQMLSQEALGSSQAFDNNGGQLQQQQQQQDSSSQQLLSPEQMMQMQQLSGQAPDNGGQQEPPLQAQTSLEEQQQQYQQPPPPQQEPPQDQFSSLDSFQVPLQQQPPVLGEQQQPDPAAGTAAANPETLQQQPPAYPDANDPLGVGGVPVENAANVAAPGIGNEAIPEQQPSSSAISQVQQQHESDGFSFQQYNSPEEIAGQLQPQPPGQPQEQPQNPQSLQDQSQQLQLAQEQTQQLLTPPEQAQPQEDPGGFSFQQYQQPQESGAAVVQAQQLPVAGQPLQEQAAALAAAQQPPVAGQQPAEGSATGGIAGVQAYQQTAAGGDPSQLDVSGGSLDGGGDPSQYDAVPFVGLVDQNGNAINDPNNSVINNDSGSLAGGEQQPPGNTLLNPQAAAAAGDAQGAAYPAAAAPAYGSAQEVGAGQQGGSGNTEDLYGREDLMQNNAGNSGTQEAPMNLFTEEEKAELASMEQAQGGNPEQAFSAAAR